MKGRNDLIVLRNAWVLDGLYDIIAVVEFKQEATHTPAAVALPELLNLLVDRVAPHMDVLPYTPHLAKVCLSVSQASLGHDAISLPILDASDNVIHFQVNEVLQRLVLTIDAHALSVADTARLCTASRYHECVVGLCYG
jgi:hypothetical protein